MGRRNVRQRVHRAYMRPQLAAIDQRAQFVELAAVLTGEDEVVAGVLAPGLDQVLRLGDVYDADDPAQLRQHVGAAGQGVAADGVEHDIDAAAVGQAHDGVDVVFLFVVDDLVGSLAASEFEVGFADGGVDLGADRLGELDCDVAHAACAAVNQDAFADPQPGAHDQGFPCRAAHQGQAGRFKMAERRGLFADDAFGGDVVFGVAARAVEDLRGVPDFVADGEGGDAGADGFDDAGHIVAGDGGQGHQVRVVASADLVIQRVDGGGLHADQNLSRLGHGLGQVTQFEGVRAAKGGKY